MRKQDKRGDFGRNDRQKQILNALIDRMSSASNIAKIDKIAEKASENVETNIRITEGLALQQIYSGFTSKKIGTLSITGSDLYLGPNNTYYFEPDATNLEKVRKTLQEHLDYTPDTSSTGTDESTTTDGTTSGSSYSNDSSTSTNSTTNSTTDSSY